MEETTADELVAHMGVAISPSSFSERGVLEREIRVTSDGGIGLFFFALYT